MLLEILEMFLLPSVFLLVLILAGLILIKTGVKIKKKKYKIGWLLLFSGIIFYYLFSITPIADLILLPLERQHQPILENELGKADKIVLLLGGDEANVLRASEVLRLYEQGQSLLSIIISGRDPVNPEKKEGEGVKEYLIERGVLPEKIILENESKNTFEHAKNIEKMVEQEPFFLVTSAFHLPRAMETFKKKETLPIPAPTDFKIERARYDIFDFFPNPKNLRNSNLGLREYIAILYYRLFLF